jgi:hypothetical protein
MKSLVKIINCVMKKKLTDMENVMIIFNICLIINKYSFQNESLREKQYSEKEGNQDSSDSYK